MFALVFSALRSHLAGESLLAAIGRELPTSREGCAPRLDSPPPSGFGGNSRSASGTGEFRIDLRATEIDFAFVSSSENSRGEMIFVFTLLRLGGEQNKRYRDELRSVIRSSPRYRRAARAIDPFISRLFLLCNCCPLRMFCCSLDYTARKLIISLPFLQPRAR